MAALHSDAQLNVAIIGGGPGGLGAAIEMSKLPFVNWTLYEKKPAISETGGGISLQRHTWRLLELNGAAKNIHPDDYFRATDRVSGQQRNGRTGELLEESRHPANTNANHLSCRMVRAKLQAALVKEVDQSRIQVSKKLVRIGVLSTGRVQLHFEDGFVDEVDLLIGADGIRSLVRSFAFPSHKIKYNGQSAYRTIINKATAQAIPGIPKTPVFWQNTSGKYVFTCPLGGADFEVTARIRRPVDSPQDHVSWGQPFNFSNLLPEYDDFCEPVRHVLQLAAEGQTQEFALFSGPRLESVIAHGALALIGDASHPLSGAFGAGAGFALEDDYALARALEWAWKGRRGLGQALELYDKIRSPHYRALYHVLDEFAELNAGLLAEGLPVDEEIEQRVKRSSEAKNTWMYRYEVDKAVDRVLSEVDGASLENLAASSKF